MLGSLLLNSPSSAQGRMVQDAMKDYFTLASEKELMEEAGHHFFGSGAEEDENRHLDIALKKRQLEMLGPQDTQEYNATPAAKILSSLGITWAKDLQPPAARAGIAPSQDSGFLSHFKAFGNVADPKEFNDASRSLDLILSNGLRPNAVERDASIARKLSRIASFL
jgi:hypothetical protein